MAMLVTALAFSPLSIAHGAEGPGQAVNRQVQTQQDPFGKLRALDEGRIASTWSSLPWADGCKNDVANTALAAHVSALAESASAAQDQRTGPFDLIDPRYRVQLDATAQVGCVVGQLAVQRQVGTQGDFWSADGSALSWRINEQWRVGVGLIARQWGPAWDGSLILDTSARPFASLSVDARSGPLPSSSFWWWLGEVDFSVFFGELESDRGDYPRPYLNGLRLVIRPTPSLELGVSRVAQWGGEGRDNSLGTFWDMLIGRDNQVSDGVAADQPGNQLGGFDARWNLSAWLPGVGLYAQAIGEDEASGAPYKYLYQGGMDWRRDGALAFAEFAHTTAKNLGTAYNHFIYTDGYRYKGRPLGHWADGDSSVLSVGGLLSDLAGGQGLAVLRYGTLNSAGINPTWPESRLVAGSLQWRTEFDKSLRLTLSADYFQLNALPGTPEATHDRDAQLRVQLEWWH